MKSPFRLFLFFIFFCIAAPTALATHLVGGELYYEDLGNNQYKITFKSYRDCYNGLAPFDNPAYIYIYNSTGTLVQTVEMYSPSVTSIPIVTNNPCLIPPSNVCVEEGVYEEIIFLPPITNGYDLVYQRCCRNNTIVNLANPSTTGSTYVAHIPGTNVVSKNSSPNFNNFPPLFLCIYDDIDFDHSATDPDGDILVYELCDPYLGADSACPMPNPSAGSFCPTSPTLPYQNVQWAAGYSSAYPLNSSPAISIDPSTGKLTGKPSMVGQFVVGVCVSEYRNGILISTTKRDFQFNVLDCDNIYATIPSQQQFCNGYTYSFSNTNTKAVKYYWNFNDPNSTSDTAIIANPTYTYADSGTYTVTHIAWNNQGCVDTAYTTVYIYPNFKPSIKPFIGQCITNNSFDFYADGLFESYATFNWNFGSSASPSSSIDQNPQGIVFSNAGNLPISVTVSENGCTQTVNDTVDVYPLPVANFTILEQSGCEPFVVPFTDESVTGTPLSYLWDFGDGSTSTEVNPIHTYQQEGIYDVLLTIISSSGCIDTLTFVQNDLIEVLVSPQAAISVDVAEKSIFEATFDFTDLSSGATTCVVEMGNGDNNSNCGNFNYEYADTGNYKVTQVVYNNIGCADTAIIWIRVDPEYRFFIPNTFTPGNDNLNEIFKPITMGVGKYSFYIFNRWGKLVFESHDILTGWNGQMMNTGAMSPNGVYTYLIQYGNIFKKEFEYRGIVTLLR